MNSEIHTLIDNQIGYSGDRDYAAIIGATVSGGARSPKLWNAAFAAHDIDAEMLAFDVSPANLDASLQALDGDQHFIGGAVAAPYKENIAAWLGDRLTPECAAIGAANCLYRDAGGRLMGTNTDGEGALSSLRGMVGSVQGRKVALVGLGGAGKAVAAYVARAIGDAGQLSVANRSSDGAGDFAKRIGANLIAWPLAAEDLAGRDILINCTSVGTCGSMAMTPLAGSENDDPETNNRMARQLLQILKPEAVVFDIIYDPSPTRLLALAAEINLETLDGSDMNLEQAVLAFGYAVLAPVDAALTRSSMQRARNQA